MKAKLFHIYFILSASIPFGTANNTYAQQTQATDSLRIHQIPAATIIDTSDTRLFTGHPGSVSVISTREIRQILPLNGSEVFRRTTGLFLSDEDPIGLRINIGIRGLDPDRSRTVMILEDGIPVSLNPYGEPEMYYTPPIDRMSGVEILKGSGQIIYGPQTIGGVINYLTADVPKTSSGNIRLFGGMGGLLNAGAGYGNSFKSGGFYFSVLRKQGKNVGPLDFYLTDLQGKIQFKSGPKSSITIKTGLYQENSNATYLGLTQSMYDSGKDLYAVMAPDDQLSIRRASLNLTHNLQLRSNLKIKTSIFGYGIVRNWRRQDFKLTPASNLSGQIWGDTTVAEGAVYMQNSNAHRNRQFLVAGLAPELHWNFNTGPLSHRLIAGLRLMLETAYEQRINGSFPSAASGQLVDDETRTGKALAAFLQHQLRIGNAWTLTPGLRIEHYDFHREIFRLANKDTLITGGDITTALIPGIGFSWQKNEQWFLFAGLHRGFAPPRVKDAISNSGASYQLDAELSWNYELGLRTRPFPGFTTEITGFYMDFSNQIIPVSESSGMAGAGLVNGGASRHLGAELGFSWDLAETFGAQNWKYSIDAGITYVNAVLSSDRYLQQDGQTLNLNGNRLPYAPEWILTSSLILETPFGLGIKLTGNYQSAVFTDLANTQAAAPSGRIGQIPGRFIADASVFFYEKVTHLEFMLSVKNITDEVYIASRRPQGIRVGMPRYILGGVTFRF